MKTRILVGWTKYYWSGEKMDYYMPQKRYLLFFWKNIFYFPTPNKQHAINAAMEVSKTKSVSFFYK